MKNSTPLIIAVVIFLAVLLVCCACAIAIAGASLYFTVESDGSTFSVPEPTVQLIPTDSTDPGKESEPILQVPAQPTPPVQVTSIIPTPVFITGTLTETLHTMENTIVPVNDPVELAERLENKVNLPVSLEFQVKTYQVGDQEKFWVTNSDTNENIQIDATLRFESDHVYFWIEDGVRFNERHLKALVETFEEKIYPTNREFFGSEWTPGVDADPHLYILYARGLGGSVAGYFSSADEYLPIVREYSNGHEMFLLSADHIDLNEEFAYSVLAHEFQHMIHWYRDRNEETWLNEGASELASFLNGYTVGGHDWMYASNPDIQLTDWPNNAVSNADHYGASFLFTAYFLDRFGEEATKALVANPANGMVSIDETLAEMNFRDPRTGLLITADQFFMDWVITNFIQDRRVGDGRYVYRNYPSAPKIEKPTHEITKCPAELDSPSVHQYGVNYIRITCKGEYTINFEGDSTISMLPANPYSGEYAFYSNRGDESNMTLTRTFDFSDVSGPLTFNYWTWYDLEKDYDYLYLIASVDGENWQILTTPSGTAEDPSGNSYGWGYNGLSGGQPEWIQESVDISQFAGEKVQLRFEYVTDAAVNGEGFLLDDVSIPEIGYHTDFESPESDWIAEGFVRIQNVLPQTYQLALIEVGRQTTVTVLPFDSDNRVQIPVEIGGDVREVILVVSGSTRFTRQKAPYSLNISPR